MTELTAASAAHALRDPIGTTGGAWLLSPDVLGPSKDHGYPNGFVYYFLGRGGVLGDVDADVVSSAFGFFEPSLVRTMWEQGLQVETPRESARRYGAACAEYGRQHLGACAGVERYVELAERLVDGAPIIGLSLFAGWRAEPRPDDTLGRAYFLTHVLREWRGSVHVAAAAASGLTPLETILTAADGVNRAKLIGWGDSFEDVSHLVDHRKSCEKRTDEICAIALERLFSPDELAELVGLAAQIAAAHH